MYAVFRTFFDETEDEYRNAIQEPGFRREKGKNDSVKLIVILWFL